MGGTVHIDGLLHLAAITVVATAAYIGLDRVRREPDRFQRQLQDVRTRVHNLLLRLDVKQSDKSRLKDLFNKAPVYILCHVAEEPIELGWWRRGLHACHRQWHIPILGYFRRRTDIIVVAILSIMSYLIFVALIVASLLEAEKSFPMATPVWLSFVFLAGTLLWMFITVALSYRLQQIDEICKRFEAQVDGYVDETYRDALKVINQRLPHRD